MYKFLSLLAILILLFSCKEQNEEPRPNLSQTLNYLSNNLTNGYKVIGYSYIERSISFQVNGEDIIYRTEFIDPADNTHWEMTQNFSFGDISYIEEENTNSIKGIILKLKNRSNHRITKSLNGKPIHRDIPVDEFLESVYVTVESSKFEGVKKAFENLLKLKREQNGADYFEN